MGAQWLSGRVLDLRLRGHGFKPHRRHWGVALSKNINPSLVLVQPRKTHPFITERLLMGRKESNQTNKQRVNRYVFSQLNSSQITNLPGIQAHVNSPIPSKHVASFWQGSDSHSLILIVHSRPVIPGGQSQRKLPGVLTQVPPCSHRPFSAIKNYLIIYLHVISLWTKATKQHEEHMAQW